MNNMDNVHRERKIFEVSRRTDIKERYSSCHGDNRLLKPSNGLVKGSLISGLDLKQLQIRPHSESVSRPYTLLN